MIKAIKCIFEIFDKDLKIFSFFILFLLLFAMIFEMLGLSLLFPLISQISDNEINKNFLFIVNLSKVFVSNEYIEKLILNENSRIYYLIFLIFLIFTLKFIVLLSLDYSRSRFQFKIQEFISNKLFLGYLSKNYIFHIKNNSALLTRNITKEVDELTINSIFPILLLLTDFFTVIAVFLVLFFFQPLETMFALIVGATISFLFLKFTKKLMKNLGEKRQLLEGEKLKIFNQSLKSIKEIKIYKKEFFFFKFFMQANNKFAKVSTKQSFYNFMPQSLFEYLAVISVLLFIFIFTLSTKSDSDVLATLGLFVAAIFRTVPASFRIVSCMNRLRFSNPSLQLITSQVKEFKNITNLKNQKKGKFSSNEFIKLENISFSYNNKDYLFKNVNLTINKGDLIGIKGKSGSGKTTLINIILGLLQPSNGKVKIDKKDKNFLGIKKGIFSYVPQEIYLTDDTILNNIILGDDEKSFNSKKFNEVIQNSCSDFIYDFQKGVNTIVGEGGINLSGGQKQRIGIARALYNYAPIIIFDESTSALDEYTEKVILKNLLSQIDLTIIIISHRKKTIDQCRKIIEIKNDGVFVREKKRIS